MMARAQSSGLRLQASSFRSPFFSLLLICGLAAFLSTPVRAAEPQWITVSSAHFSVVTDAGEKKGREVALRFEQMRAVFAQLLMKNRVNLPVPLEIVALKGDKEYAQVAPFRQGQAATAPAFFLAGDDRIIIVLNLFEDDPWRAIAHEFAHLLLNYNYPPTPGWFDEGFAEYFSSLRLDNKQAQLGSDPELSPSGKQDGLSKTGEARNSPKSLTELLSAPAWLSIPDLFTTKHDTSADHEDTPHTLFHAESWIVMHYLLNKNKMPETGTYFDLVQNQKVAVEQAIQKAYGMTAEQFEQAVKDYFRSLAPLFLAPSAVQQPNTTNPGAPVYRFPTPVGPDDISGATNPLPGEEADAMLAEIRARLPERREQALQELKGMTNQAPTDNAIAHRALAWADIEKKEYPQAIAELGKAMELNPRDPWVRYYLALVKYSMAQASGQPFQGLSNMMQDLRAVLDWYPEFAEAYSMLGMARVEGGGINSAMESMRAAILLSPRNESYLLNMARIYIAAKKWDAAVAMLDRLKASSNPQIAAAARRHLEDLPTLKKYGMLPQRPAETAQQSAESKPLPEPPRPAPPAPKPPPKPTEANEPEEEPPKPVEPAPDKRPIKFLKGKLVSVDCSQAPIAWLTVVAGPKAMKLRTQDYKSLLLIGADEFSCGWKDRPVAINYKAGGKADGDLVSLEVQ